MPKFPSAGPIQLLLKKFVYLCFRLLRVGNHIAMLRENPDGTKTPLTMPNHRLVKGSTLRTILNQSGIARDEFLEAYQKS